MYVFGFSESECARHCGGWWRWWRWGARAAVDAREMGAGSGGWSHAGGARSASTTAAGPSSMRPRLASALCAAGAMVLRGGGGWPSSPGAGRVCFSLDALLGRLGFGRRTKCRGEDDARSNGLARPTGTCMHLCTSVSLRRGGHMTGLSHQMYMNLCIKHACIMACMHLCTSVFTLYLL